MKDIPSRNNLFFTSNQKLETQTGESLYNKDYEHDACGVGMLVNIHGDKSHELVDSALKVLENMKHRGAEGADNKADLVLLAMGFMKPRQPEFANNVFIAGDAATGASLVTRCIAGGRKAATGIDNRLFSK